MKLWEMMIEQRLREGIRIMKNQFGFMQSRSTIEVIHLIWRLMEFYDDRKKDFHMMFTDWEKTYDKVPREVLWRCLENKGISIAYIKVIRDMYEGVSTRVRTLGGDTTDFP